MEVESEDEARMRIHMTIDGESGLLGWAMARLFRALEPPRNHSEVTLSSWPERSTVIIAPAYRQGSRYLR